MQPEITRQELGPRQMAALTTALIHAVYWEELCLYIKPRRWQSGTKCL